MTLTQIEGGEYKATIRPGYIHEQMNQVVNSIKYDMFERNFGVMVTYDE